MATGSQAYYSENSGRLIEYYRSLSPLEIYKDVLPYFPAKPGQVLDIGAASFRDSNWLAHRGHSVISVEPAAGMRDAAVARGLARGVTVFDSALPDLPGVDRFIGGFDFILCAAVIMHLSKPERQRTFEKIYELLKPENNSRAVITFKCAPAEPDREMYALNVEEVVHEIRQVPFDYTILSEAKDLLQRAGTSWHSVVAFKK